jgi:hypothetical protein
MVTCNLTGPDTSLEILLVEMLTPKEFQVDRNRGYEIVPGIGTENK